MKKRRALIAAMLGLTTGAAFVAPMAGTAAVATQTNDSAVVVVRWATARVDSVRVAWSYDTVTVQRTYAAASRSADTLRVRKQDAASRVAVLLTARRRGRTVDTDQYRVRVAARVVDSVALDAAFRDSFPTSEFRPVGMGPDTNNWLVIPFAQPRLWCELAVNRYTGEARIIVDYSVSDTAAAQIERECSPVLDAYLIERAP